MGGFPAHHAGFINRCMPPLTVVIHPTFLVRPPSKNVRFAGGNRGRLMTNLKPPPENDPPTLGGYNPPAARYVG